MYPVKPSPPTNKIGPSMSSGAWSSGSWGPLPMSITALHIDSPGEQVIILLALRFPNVPISLNSNASDIPAISMTLISKSDGVGGLLPSGGDETPPTSVVTRLTSPACMRGLGTLSRPVVVGAAAPPPPPPPQVARRVNESVTVAKRNMFIVKILTRLVAQITRRNSTGFPMIAQP